MRIGLFCVLCALAGAAGAQDLSGFLSRADSLAGAGEAAELAALVAAHPLWIGAATGQLVEDALQAAAAGDSLAGRRQLEWARTLGRLHAEQGGSLAPQREAQRALDWGPQARATRQAGRELSAQADAARQSGDADRAVQLLEQALAQHESIADERSQAVLHGSLGVVHWARQDWAAVRRHYERALALRRALDDKILEGRTLNGMGSLEFITGNPTGALNWYEQAIELRRQSGDLAGLGTSLSYAGNCQRQLGEPLKARELYEEALPVLEAVGDERKCVETLDGIGVLYWQMGRHRDAENVLRRAIERAPLANAADHLPRLRLDLASALRSQGKLREGLDSVAEARRELAAAPDAALGLHADREAGLCQLGLGDRDAARDAFVSAVQTARALGAADAIGDALVDLATLYLEIGAPERGRSAAEEALSLARTRQDRNRERDALSALGVAQWRAGDAQAAVTTLQAALDSDLRDGRLAFVPDDEVQLAGALSDIGEVERARALLRSALRRLAADGRADYAWPPLLSLGHGFERSQPDSAAYWYGRAIERMESDRERFGASSFSTSFLSTQRGSAYEAILHYYAQQELSQGDGLWLERAFELAERSRASGLRELIDAKSLGDDAQAAAWLDSIVAQSEHPAARRRAEAAYMQRLRERRQEQGYRAPSVDVATLRQALPKRCLYLEYAVTDSASYLFASDRQRTSLHELPPRAELSQHVRALHDALARPGSADPELRRSARALYDALLLPIAARLAEVELVWIAPDDALHELPFELLLREDAAGSLGELDWFGRDYAVGYTPSASLFLQQRAKTEGRGVLAIGDPSFASQPPRGSQLARALDPLPHARTEVRALAAHFREGDAQILIGDSASKAALRQQLSAKHPRVLHLATHGIVDPRQPNLSCIALARTATDDGYLYAPEILELPLQLELVVLSACESGRGRIERGEGVVGLTRSFLAAGAQAVLCSLWSVADLSTSQLMDHFYSEWSKGESGPQALRAARIALMSAPATEHPFYWAPFVFIGDLKSATRQL